MIDIKINDNTRIKNDFIWNAPFRFYIGISIKIKF